MCQKASKVELHLKINTTIHSHVFISYSVNSICVLRREESNEIEYYYKEVNITNASW